MGDAGLLTAGTPPTQAPTGLTVLYDAGCRVCVRATDWLARQPAYVAMEFVAAGSAQARRRFPGLDPRETLRDVTVVADTGAIYRGSNAWVMCLWALRRHRALAYSLSTPALAPRAKRFVAWISRHRGLLGGS